MFSAILFFALEMLSDTAATPAAPAGSYYTHVGPTPPPHGLPVLRSFKLSSYDIHPGTPVSGSVETSENVNYVEARVGYRELALHRDAPGKFSLTYTVPWWLPFWLRHEYDVSIVVRNVDGVELWQPLHVRVR